MRVKFLLAAFIATVGGLVACKTAQPAQSAAKTTKLFSLPYQQVSTVAVPGAGTIQAKFTAVADSRCPSDVTCIWAGLVGVTLEIQDKTAPQTLRLGYERNHSSDSLAIVLNQHPYWLRLLDVTPYPAKASEGQPKVAILRLRPR